MRVSGAADACRAADDDIAAARAGDPRVRWFVIQMKPTPIDVHRARRR
jgi:hypothetical protein